MRTAAKATVISELLIQGSLNGSHIGIFAGGTGGNGTSGNGGYSSGGTSAPV